MPGHFLFSLLLNTELLVREGLLNGLPSIISGFLFLWVHSWWCRQSNYLCTSDDARRSSTQRPHLLWLKQFWVLHKEMQTFFLEKNLRQPSFVLKVSLAKNYFLAEKRTHTMSRGCVHVISDNLFFVCKHGLFESRGTSASLCGALDTFCRASKLISLPLALNSKFIQSYSRIYVLAWILGTIFIYLTFEWNCQVTNMFSRLANNKVLQCFLIVTQWQNCFNFPLT